MSELHFPWLHPVIGGFPARTEAEIDALTADIAKNGQRKPVVLYQGYLWDGRARAEACRRLGIQPVYGILRRIDPISYLIANNIPRLGNPRSPERDAALTILERIETDEFKAKAKQERAEWMTEARREFRASIKDRQPCAVCGEHAELVHAHHSFPLNIQYDMGIDIANHEHDWLCPSHHATIHLYVSVYFLGSKPREILGNIRDTRKGEWSKTRDVFDKGYRLYRKYGGYEFPHAQWNPATDVVVVR